MGTYSVAIVSCEKKRKERKLTTKNSKLICVAWFENAKKASKPRGAWERAS